MLVVYTHTDIEYQAFPERLKWPERVPQHSSSFSTEVKNLWNFTCSPPYVTAVCVVIHKDNFIYLYRLIILNMSVKKFIGAGDEGLYFRRFPGFCWSSCAVGPSGGRRSGKPVVASLNQNDFKYGNSG